MLTSLLLAVVVAAGTPATEPSYQAEIARWRERREAGLKADDGWLTLAGLFWLKDGSNTVGADAASDIVLPKGSAPDLVGEFDFHAGKTSFQAAPGVTIQVNGQSLQQGTSPVLKADSADSPDVLQINDLTMFVIQRGDRYGIRVKDKNSEVRKRFKGLKYYPANEAYRVKAKFVPYNPPKMIPVPNILGQVEDTPSPGYVEFTLNGHACRLDPVTEGDSLFFIFKDLTSGKETYPPGRFLDTAMPKDGVVVLDFNKAYNPPCAFTPYATCPLPPEENKLGIAIEAGELRYGH
ncbi:MAG TPA: DUF1684 domain-containing protein [Terriglobia bacterium]|nr:DUF1684 domain-containing protein [Terriglobia bacterium]